MVNGVTQIAMTKLDVLNTFPEIYTATAYRIGDVVSEDIPYDLCASPIEPIWKSHPGWQQPLPAEGAFQALPLEARSYLQFLENALQTPISMISTGPERSQLIIRPTDY
jgi:adenylosuccinate synthase